MVLDLYERMLLIRLFEERVGRLFADGRLNGTVHLCIGQEAVAVGACAALERGDYVISTHRGHGHLLAKGGDPGRLLAELYGREAGYARGRGGSQHVCCMEVGFLGSNGITGGGLPVGTGAALYLRQHRRSEVVVCFFGDGASNQGTFHEALNMAAVWKLPIVYVCENNLYAMSAPAAKLVSVRDISDRARAYGMPGGSVDGNDVLEVKAAVEAAVARARAGEGPTLLECKTYRLCGHSKSDPRNYRTRAEEKEWRARDPIPRFRERLLAHAVNADELAAVEQAAAAAVERAQAFADEVR